MSALKQLIVGLCFGFTIIAMAYIPKMGTYFLAIYIVPPQILLLFIGAFLFAKKSVIGEFLTMTSYYCLVSSSSAILGPLGGLLAFRRTGEDLSQWLSLYGDWAIAQALSGLCLFLIGIGAMYVNPRPWAS
jgi:hypothetical protein